MKASSIIAFTPVTWCALTILICCILLIEYYVFNQIFNKKQIKLIDSIKEDCLYAERKRFSVELHDEIGPNLSALKLYCELALKKGTNTEEIHQIYKMMNELNEKIIEVTWNLNLDGDKLESLIDFICEQSRKLLAHSGISFKVSIPRVIPVIEISNFVKRNVYLLIKELIHNSLKHSKAKQIYLIITLEAEFICFKIKDNGIGFTLDINKPNAMGLNNVKERIERLSGSISIENNKETNVLIKVPLAKVMANVN
ncbi:sensor histidine kinase [Pedobacter aquatilis]|uniref:sensor histidine kinase n=1 Tax=Pedobacter aquatilis TaxID=351343 RepID=UPI00292E2A59|nr:ATP-binding protein [Pedobacter aquatilis]